MSKLKIKDFKITNLLSSNFVKNKVNIGYNKMDNHPCMVPFLKKSNSLHSVFNLSQTHYQIVIVRNKIHKLLTSGQKILFISHDIKYKKVISNIANQLLMPAILENYPDDLFEKMYMNKKEENINKFMIALKDSQYWSKLSNFEKIKINEIIENNNNSLNSSLPISILPKAIFIIDPNSSHKVIRDAHKYGVLIFSFVNSNNSPLGIDYFIPANNQDVESVETVLNQIFNDSLYSMIKNQSDNTNTDSKLFVNDDTFDFNNRTILGRIIRSFKSFLNSLD